MMTIARYYIYAAALAAVIVIGYSAAAVYSNRKTDKLERLVETAKQNAEAKELQAFEKEKEANEYKAKIEYLEQRIAEIKTIAGKQDKEIAVLGRDSSAARTDVQRAARVRSIAANADELCEKLAGLGHPCEE